MVQNSTLSDVYVHKTLRFFEARVFKHSDLYNFILSPGRFGLTKDIMALSSYFRWGKLMVLTPTTWPLASQRARIWGT